MFVEVFHKTCRRLVAHRCRSLTRFPATARHDWTASAVPSSSSFLKKREIHAGTFLFSDKDDTDPKTGGVRGS